MNVNLLIKMLYIFYKMSVILMFIFVLILFDQRLESVLIFSANCHCQSNIYLTVTSKNLNHIIHLSNGQLKTFGNFLCPQDAINFASGV